MLAERVRLADPIELIDRQRREYLRRLRQLNDLAEQARGLAARLAVEGAVLHLQADLVGLPLGFAVEAGIAAGIEGTVHPSPAEVVLVTLGAVATAGLLAALPVLAQRRSLVQALAVE